jgi:hypothetical protein
VYLYHNYHSPFISVYSFKNCIYKRGIMRRAEE